MASGEPVELPNIADSDSKSAEKGQEDLSESDSDGEERLTRENCYDDGLRGISKMWTSDLPDYQRVRDSMLAGASNTMNLYHLQRLREERKHTKELKILHPSFPNSQHLAEIVSVDKKKKKINVSSTTEKISVVQQIQISINTAIQNGNKSFVRGGLHPLQTNLGVLLLNRQSGYSNNFTDEDYLYVLREIPLPETPSFLQAFS